ncbi:hypothetical protein KO527_19440 [Pseudoalteromonas sp. C2R02]|uniref:hypothetical protein n=1 Tax=Pseudoalteromonas sp. C2R02 TaxID=2841565 RepID=UPI001C09500E|nr:hypothetical protein [Pseudoalteromonas sp. C2R02]MBU2971523.1 hypothetical protein [Pseudoalteromonas sp. C2R02]
MKTLLLTFLSFAIIGCTNIQFNDRYENLKWPKVIIAPFNGEDASIAEVKFEHHFATSSQIEVIPPSLIMMLLKDNDLIEAYENDQTKALFILAEKIDAKGILLAEVDSKPMTRSSYAEADIMAKLIDVKTKTLVATSHHETTSIISNSESLIKDVAEDSIDDFDLVFERLHGVDFWTSFLGNF